MAKLKVKPEYNGKVQAEVDGRMIQLSNRTSQADLKLVQDACNQPEFFVVDAGDSDAENSNENGNSQTN